jgi:hypothetical protein
MPEPGPTDERGKQEDRWQRFCRPADHRYDRAIIKLPLRADTTFMEIAIIVILFLVGSVGGAIQALKYLERRRPDSEKNSRPRDDSTSDDS